MEKTLDLQNGGCNRNLDMDVSTGNFAQKAFGVCG